MATHAMTWNHHRHGRHAASLLVEALAVLHRMWLALWTGQLPRRHGRHERPEPARPEWERHEGATPAYAAELARWNAEHLELLDTAPLIFHTPLEEIYGQHLPAPDSLPGA